MLHSKYFKKLNLFLIFSLISIQTPVNSQIIFKEKTSNFEKKLEKVNNNFKNNFNSLLVQNINQEQDIYSEEIIDIENMVEELFDSEKITDIDTKLNDKYEEPIKKEFDDNKKNKRIKTTIKLENINKKSAINS